MLDLEIPEGIHRRVEENINLAKTNQFLSTCVAQ